QEESGDAVLVHGAVGGIGGDEHALPLVIEEEGHGAVDAVAKLAPARLVSGREEGHDGQAYDAGVLSHGREPASVSKLVSLEELEPPVDRLGCRCWRVGLSKIAEAEPLGLERLLFSRSVLGKENGHGEKDG